jgi:hypothetical protein
VRCSSAFTGDDHVADEEKSKGQTISLAQAPTLLNRSPSWVSLLVSKGYITRDGYGKYSVVAIVRGALSYYEDLLEKSNKAAAASRATDAGTREIELRIAERRRHLIPHEDARAVVGEMAAMVKAEFSGLPARSTRDMVGAFVVLDAQAITDVAMAVRVYVQACFDNEAELKAEVEAATTAEEIAAVDLATDWP